MKTRLSYVSEDLDFFRRTTKKKKKKNIYVNQKNTKVEEENEKETTKDYVEGQRPPHQTLYKS